MIVLVIFLVILVALIAAYFLYFIKPASRIPTDTRLLCDYAHRGLHSRETPENSLAAFSAACEAGYGIELDIQLSSDGAVMVFHDPTLLRMTGYNVKLSEQTAAVLFDLRLYGTAEHIPQLSEVLSLVNGRVPILVELKGESMDTALCDRAAELLSRYNGPYCIESFNPMLLHAMKKRLPDAYIGLLYTNVCKAKKKTTLLNILLTLMAFNFLAKPDFIAYDKAERRAIPVRIAAELYHAGRFVWTLRPGDARMEGEHAIFEE